MAVNIKRLALNIPGMVVFVRSNNFFREMNLEADLTFLKLLLQMMSKMTQSKQTKYVL